MPMVDLYRLITVTKDNLGGYGRFCTLPAQSLDFQLRCSWGRLLGCDPPHKVDEVYGPLTVA